MIFKFLHHRFLFYLLATALVWVAACANPVAPTGGPKDITPPSVMKSVPANQGVNFNGDRIILTFSEFVSLKDINNQLVVSPPLSKPPEFSMHGKNLSVKFKEPLRENSTYSLFFGDAIVDLTESNPLAGFSFSFSTGPVLDSLSLKGKLFNALNLKPVTNAYVMLYDSVYDSVPYKQRPYYLAKTNASGEFVLNNLRNLEYLMFALTDINGNYLFDLPTEEIAFADSLVRPVYFGYDKKQLTVPSLPGADSLIRKKDSLPAEEILKNSASQLKSGADSLQSEVAEDSIPKAGVSMQATAVPSYTMHLFREADTTQRLLKGAVLRENVIGISFRHPVKTFAFTPIKPAYQENWSVIHFNKSRDTLTVWIPEPLSDSLMVEVSDNETVLDTLDLALKPAAPVASKGRQTVDKKKILSVKTNLKGSKIRPDNLLKLTFADPVTSFNSSGLRLFADTNLLSPKTEFLDSLKLILGIQYKWKEGENYRLEIPDSTFISLFGHPNDSISHKFSPMTETETGSLKMAFTISEPGSYIIQLLDDKETVLEEQTITKDTDLIYNYLSARKYRIKAIWDKNSNGKWDTGNYLRKQQPEDVFYFPKDIELRTNWTIEEEWSIM